MPLRSFSPPLQTVKEGVYGDLARESRTRAKFVKASETYAAAYDLIPDGRHAMLVENVVCRKVYSDYFSMTGEVLREGGWEAGRKER